jgi:hypothetical protein
MATCMVLGCTCVCTVVTSAIMRRILTRHQASGRRCCISSSPQFSTTFNCRLIDCWASALTITKCPSGVLRCPIAVVAAGRAQVSFIADGFSETNFVSCAWIASVWGARFNRPDEGLDDVRSKTGTWIEGDAESPKL